MARGALTTIVLAMMLLAVVPLSVNAEDSGGVQASESTVAISPSNPVEGGSATIRLTLYNSNNFEVEDIGTLEAFLTDGLRTLLKSDEKISEIPNLLEYTIRYPGHAQLVKELIAKDRFSNEIVNFNGTVMTQKEKTCLELFEEWKLLEDDEEFTFMIITAVKRDDSEILGERRPY